MAFGVDTSFLSLLINSLAIPLIGYGVSAVKHFRQEVMDAITENRAELAKLANRLERLEEHVVMHDKLDENRFETLQALGESNARRIELIGDGKRR